MRKTSVGLFEIEERDDGLAFLRIKERERVAVEVLLGPGEARDLAKALVDFSVRGRKLLRTGVVRAARKAKGY